MNLSYQAMNHRRGVSLLEVLVSIGVTSVGLLGVLALIPLGGAQTRQGQVAERAPTIGNSAFAEIRSRDMLSAPLSITNPVNICIDPLGLTSGGAGTFPTTASAQMSRISPSDGNGGTMGLAMARSVFVSQDDLSIAFPGTGTQLLDAPPDRSVAPQQIWNVTKNSADASVKRLSQASMSWFATVHPNYGSATYGQGCDTFTVSVVVVNRRILDPTLQTEFTTNVLAASTDFPGAGIAGGDVVLTFPTADQAKEAKTPENSWLMLGGRKLIYTDPMTGQRYYLDLFQWYRVLASDQTSPTQRQVTLAGPDWDTSLESIQATIIPGTVAVYQRNMQLESSTLWRN